MTFVTGETVATGTPEGTATKTLFVQPGNVVQCEIVLENSVGC